MDAGFRDRLLENTFGVSLLELTIDHESFTEMLDTLKHIAAQWKGQRQVDKEILHFIIEMLMIIRNTLRYPDPSFDKDDLSQIEKMHDELQRIVLEECLVD